MYIPHQISWTKSKKMNEFLNDLLKEKNENDFYRWDRMLLMKFWYNLIDAIDEILGKIQKSALSVTGPLPKVWLKLENPKRQEVWQSFFISRQNFKFC